MNLPSLSLNILDFNLTFCKNCNCPLKKEVTPHFPATNVENVELNEALIYIRVNIISAKIFLLAFACKWYIWFLGIPFNYLKIDIFSDFPDSRSKCFFCWFACLPLNKKIGQGYRQIQMLQAKKIQCCVNLKTYNFTILKFLEKLVSHRMSHKNQQLAYKCWQLKKARKIHSNWSFNNVTNVKLMEHGRMEEYV